MALANQIPDEALAAIEDVVRHHPDGVSAPEILRVLANPMPSRTLQYRLKHLVTRNRLIVSGAAVPHRSAVDGGGWAVDL
jgi:hypothetical protein